MRIGLDFVNLRSYVDGVGRFARQLVEGLQKYGAENEYWIYLPSDLPDPISLDRGSFHRLDAPARTRRFWPRNQTFFGGRRFRRQDEEILHSPVSVAPFFLPRSVKRIVTVHDLAFKVHPETVGWKAKIWQNLAWPLCLRQADHIVASSHSTRRDIVGIYGIPEARTSVVHLYAHLGSFPDPSALGGLRRRLGLPDRYILHVGAPHRRKNIPNLLRAFWTLKTRASIPHKLLLVGPEGWARASLESSIQELDLRSEVRFSGYIPDEEMPGVYAGADVFVFPSFYEGFGYPPLEAMEAGVPVAVSRRSSLPEVVGEAGLYFDPDSPDDIAARILEILSSRRVADELRAKGRDRIRLFTQRKMIEEYLEIYRRV